MISTARLSAVNGRSEGAAVNVVAKSGATDYHGAVFYFLRDKKLNASEVSPSNTSIETKPRFNRNSGEVRSVVHCIGAVDVLGVGGGRGTSHVVVFKDKPDDLTATLAAFGDPDASNTNRQKYRNCLRSGQCTHAGFDNLRGQPFFQLDARVTKTSESVSARTFRRSFRFSI